MNLDEITLGSLNSPGELIDLYESLRTSLMPQQYVPDTLALPLNGWAFRGQSQTFGTLVTSFQRIFGEKHLTGAAEIIETDLIGTFREHYDKLEGKTADMPESFLIGPGFDLRCLSVMQHYGVPTRLLDWSSNFWTSLYFACAGDAAKDAELWFYSRRLFDHQRTSPFSGLLQPVQKSNAPLEPRLLSSREGNTIVEFDPQMTPRMKRQYGHHTVSTDVFSDHAQLLYNLSKGVDLPLPGNQKLFGRVVISAGCKEKTLRFLSEHVNVTAGTIFPDVEGLGKFLHWHLESLVTTIL